MDRASLEGAHDRLDGHDERFESIDDILGSHLEREETFQEEMRRELGDLKALVKDVAKAVDWLVDGEKVSRG